MDTESTEKIVYFRYLCISLIVLSLALAGYSIRSVSDKPENLIYGAIFVISVAGLFYSMFWEQRKVYGIWRDVAKEFNAEATETKMTIFSGKEYTFNRMGRFMTLSLSPPYKLKVMGLADYNWRMGRRGVSIINFYVSHSCAKDLKSNIFVRDLAGKTKTETAEKYGISPELISPIQEMGTGRIYLRKGFLIYSDNKPRIITKTYLRMDAERLIRLSEAVDRC